MRVFEVIQAPEEDCWEDAGASHSVVAGFVYAEAGTVVAGKGDQTDLDHIAGEAHFEIEESEMEVVHFETVSAHFGRAEIRPGMGVRSEIEEARSGIVEVDRSEIEEVDRSGIGKEVHSGSRAESPGHQGVGIAGVVENPGCSGIEAVQVG